jgi:hypothetical protein
MANRIGTPKTRGNTYAFYPNYTGPFPAGNDVKVDITLRERLVYPLQEQAILPGYEEFENTPLDRRLQTYSLDEIVAEKTIALADRVRNEPHNHYCTPAHSPDRVRP